MSNNDYIYSPIIMEEVRKRWIEGFLQFYPPFEIGLERTCAALHAWKNYYEHLFSSEVEALLKESGCEYAKHDVDLRREDRRGNHPTIDVLGDYDVIGLNTTQKRIFIIECKVLQPIGSVFEHSNQQKRFFTKEKFDEKLVTQFYEDLYQYQPIIDIQPRRTIINGIHYILLPGLTMIFGEAIRMKYNQ